MFTELYREEKKEEGDRGGQEDKRGNEKERVFLILFIALFIIY